MRAEMLGKFRHVAMAAIVIAVVVIGIVGFNWARTVPERYVRIELERWGKFDLAIAIPPYQDPASPTRTIHGKANSIVQTAEWMSNIHIRDENVLNVEPYIPDSEGRLWGTLKDESSYVIIFEKGIYGKADPNQPIAANFWTTTLDPSKTIDKPILDLLLRNRLTPPSSSHLPPVKISGRSLEIALTQTRRDKLTAQLTLPKESSFILTAPSMFSNNCGVAGKLGVTADVSSSVTIFIRSRAAGEKMVQAHAASDKPPYTLRFNLLGDDAIVGLQMVSSESRPLRVTMNEVNQVDLPDCWPLLVSLSAHHFRAFASPSISGKVSVGVQLYKLENDSVSLKDGVFRFFAADRNKIMVYGNGTSLAINDEPVILSRWNQWSGPVHAAIITGAIAALSAVIGFSIRTLYPGNASATGKQIPSKPPVDQAQSGNKTPGGKGVSKPGATSDKARVRRKAKRTQPKV
jgi:hypothetical protein